MTRSPLPGTVLLVAVLSLLALPAPQAPAGEGGHTTQDDATAPREPTGRLLVPDMTGVVSPGSGVEAGSADLRLLVANEGPTPLDDLAVRVAVHDAVGSRSALRAALDDGAVVTPRLHTQRAEVRGGDRLASGKVTGFTVTVEGSRAGWLGRGGVYPVRLSLVRGGRTLDELVTAVVSVSRPPPSRLLTTVVWPLTDDPWRLPDGSYPPDVGEVVAPDGRLERILGAVEEHPGARVLLAPAVHLLEDLADRADGFRVRDTDGTRRVGPGADAARRAARFRDRVAAIAEDLPLAPVASPYADVALPWLVEGGAPLPRLAGTAVAEGRRRLSDLAERPADGPTTLLWDRLTPEALDVLSGTHLLLPYDHLRAPDVVGDPSADVPSPLRTLRSAAGRTVTATVADPFVTATLADPDDDHGVGPAVQRTLAEAAMIFFEAPGRSGRPLVVLPPADWAPPPGFAPAVLEGLLQAPWLRLTTPDAATVGEAPPAGRLAAPEPGPPADLRRRLGRARARLEALAGATPGGGDLAGRRRGELADQLMRAASGWLHTRDGTEAERLVAGVEDAVRRAIGSVAIPVAAGITLTSDRGEIPVTVQRTGGGPLRVRLSVRSGAGLDWPEGREVGPVTLRPGSSETVSFAVRAVSRGRVPVTVTVTDPSGRLQLGRARLAVRSTTIGTPALATVATVVLILLGIGVLRNRPRRPRLEVVE